MLLLLVACAGPASDLAPAGFADCRVEWTSSQGSGWEVYDEEGRLIEEGGEDGVAITTWTGTCSHVTRLDLETLSSTVEQRCDEHGNAIWIRWLSYDDAGDLQSAAVWTGEYTYDELGRALERIENSKDLVTWRYEGDALLPSEQLTDAASDGTIDGRAGWVWNDEGLATWSWYDANPDRQVTYRRYGPNQRVEDARGTNATTGAVTWREVFTYPDPETPGWTAAEYYDGDGALAFWRTQVWSCD